MGCVGHVEPPRGAIDGEIIPAAFATDFDLAGHVIAGRGRRKKEWHKSRRNERSHVDLQSGPGIANEVAELLKRQCSALIMKRA
jgi:hypothetical protein